LGDREMEIGIGIHGEPGRERMPLKSVDEITEILALSIINDRRATVVQSENGMRLKKNG
jgi:phosphoenolpyruvate---glycerone phosphotransferase subunit DhaK